jgi:hypothetical protein
LADVALFLTGIGAPLAVAGAAVTFGELVSSIAFETYVGSKIKKYNSRIKFIQSWLDKMYLFQSDALLDGRIDAKEIMQWRGLIEEYDREANSQNAESHESKNGHEGRGAKEYGLSTHQSVTIQKQLAQILQRLPTQQL